MVLTPIVQIRILVSREEGGWGSRLPFIKEMSMPKLFGGGAIRGAEEGGWRSKLRSFKKKSLKGFFSGGSVRGADLEAGTTPRRGSKFDSSNPMSDDGEIAQGTKEKKKSGKKMGLKQLKSFDSFRNPEVGSPKGGSNRKKTPNEPKIDENEIEMKSI
ncbi:hypothetical protein TrVE_jg9478 [Triparma verrucosa]|uniref:Uncharacterized protein n=1 Tax=Triparma verrucosa TaxID=1606542 RepID=A0A9W7C640_9STRA|nr:hypothetical protein TrVE_jg9478 [Triparma verrucosa]